MVPGRTRKAHMGTGKMNKILTGDTFLYIPATPEFTMQQKNHHTRCQAGKARGTLLCLILLTLCLAGCQILQPSPDLPSEQMSAKEFGLLRDTAAPPVVAPDPVPQAIDVPAPEEEVLPTEKIAAETREELPPDNPEPAVLEETGLIEAQITEKELDLAASQQAQPQMTSAVYPTIDEALTEDTLTEDTPGEIPVAAIDKTDPPPPPKTTQMVLDEALGFCETAQEFWQKGEFENALEALDHAYSLILGIETEDQPEHMQQKEDLRFLISKRILEIYASRNTVVNGSHNAIPMELNRHVQAEIRLFTKGGEKNFFKQSLVRSGKYRPYILSKLKEAGMPEELSWLPLIESGFKVKALSKARALGLWQFIPSTGYKFGLKRNKYIDERIDPAKSTQAAVAYLQELHGIFGDWITALAAYNCGEGRVLRVIRSQNINYLDNFWDLYERLPRETARYVPRFLAAVHIINNPDKYGLGSVIPQTPPAFETVEVSKQVQLTDIASKIGVSSQVMKELNPELRYNILPPETYSLRVPPAKATQLLASIDSIPVSHPPRPAYAYHRVRSGETLSGIADKYRTSVRRIMRANNLRSSHLIVAGKKLKIPQRGTVIAHANTAVKKPTGKTLIHRVRSGDSLWIIARRYGTTTKKIQAMNGLKKTNLYIGQRLKVPEYRYDPPVATTSANQYLVRRGDSPYKIAKRLNMSLGHLLRINDLTPRSKIFPGQVLKVE
jgi:peptidoglycan lytic transglycosylase D